MYVIFHHNALNLCQWLCPLFERLKGSSERFPSAVNGLSNVLTPLSSLALLPRYQRLFHSGRGSDRYQGLFTLPCLSLLLESPPAKCGSPTVTTLIPCFCVRMCQSLISSRFQRQMNMSWNISLRQILTCTIYSSI